MKKLLASILISVFSLSFASFAFAQDSRSALDAISDRLEEEDINVVRYDETAWGNVEGDIITRLQDEGLENLAQLEEFLLEKNINPETQPDLVILWLVVNLYGGELGDFEGITVEILNDTIDQAAETPGVDASGEAQGALALFNPNIVDQINQVTTELQFKGESQVNTILLTIARALRNIIGGIAIIFIVITGINMATAQGDESKITEQKRSITWAGVGLFAIIAIERLVTVLYGTPGVERGITPEEAGFLFSTEVLGFVAYLKAIVAAIAVFMIVNSGIRTIFSAGEEEKITQQRRAVVWVIVGLIIIVVNQTIIENLYGIPAANEILSGNQSIGQQNVNNVIGLLGNIIQFVLGFVGVIAIGGLVYGGMLMVTNYGNDEAIEKGKKIIRSSIIGIVVIIASFALINTLVIDFATELAG